VRFSGSGRTTEERRFFIAIIANDKSLTKRYDELVRQKELLQAWWKESEPEFTVGYSRGRRDRQSERGPASEGNALQGSWPLISGKRGDTPPFAAEGNLDKR